MLYFGGVYFYVVINDMIKYIQSYTLFFNFFVGVVWYIEVIHEIYHMATYNNDTDMFLWVRVRNHIDNTKKYAPKKHYADTFNKYFNT